MIDRLLRSKIGIAAILGALAFVLLHIHLYDPQADYGSDNLQNLAGAYSIAKYNTYAVYSSDQEVHPSAAREPLYPFILGMVIKARNLFADHDHDIAYKPIESINNLYHNTETVQTKHVMNKLVMVNITILFLTILLSCAFVYLATKNYLLMLYTLVALIFSAALAESAHTFLTEILAAFLCTLLSILLFLSKRMLHKRAYAITLALVTAGLVLTKAVYLYFIPIIFVYLYFTHRDEVRARDKKVMTSLAIVAFVLALSVGGWMVRNYFDFGRFFIADRKAEVLMYRAAFDATHSYEYPYFFVVWAPGLSKYFLTKSTEPNWKRLVNVAGNEPIIMDTYSGEFGPFFKDIKLEPNGSYKQKDYRRLEKKSLRKIFAHPKGHVKLSLAFLYRSFFVEDGSGLRYLGIDLPREANADKRVDSFPLALAVNLPVWLAFFYVLLRSIRKRDLACLGLVLIPSYAVLMHSLIAFSHPRYMSPLIPLLTIIFCIGINQLFAHWRGTPPKTSQF